MALAGPVTAAPTYTINKVLVAEDQYQGEKGVTPAPLYKPHETDASRAPKFWISSNERGEEAAGEEPDPATSRAGITVFKNGNNAPLSQIDIEGLCLPVITPAGSLWGGDPNGCAPPGAESARHRHRRGQRSGVPGRRAFGSAVECRPDRLRSSRQHGHGIGAAVGL
jgi:hypothetical protein